MEGWSIRGAREGNWLDVRRCVAGEESCSSEKGSLKIKRSEGGVHC